MGVGCKMIGDELFKVGRFIQRSTLNKDIIGLCGQIPSTQNNGRYAEAHERLEPA